MHVQFAKESRTIRVAVPTFRRPELLRACLTSVLQQEVPSHSVRVLVIDNDAAGSARAVADDVGLLFPGRLEYRREPEPGLAAVRNRALEESTGDDFLVFIDDDERALPGWLSQLVSAVEEFKAGVVQGLVVSEFEPGGPSWVASSRVFSRRLPARGSLLPTCAAGNVLLRVEEFVRVGIRFDPLFSEIGGEDTDYFSRLRDAGVVIVSEPAAAVIEVVPLHRQTVRWVFGRSVRAAGAWVRIRRKTAPWYMLWPSRIASGCWHGLIAVGCLVAAPFTGARGVDRVLANLGQCVGTFLGLAGAVQPGYRQGSS